MKWIGKWLDICFSLVCCFIIDFRSMECWMWAFKVKRLQVFKGVLFMLSTNAERQKCTLIPWWSHQMETFPRYWPSVRGIHRSTVNSPHKGQRRGTLMFSLVYPWLNAWVNNREAVVLRRYRAHHDVIVMQNSTRPCYRISLMKYLYLEICYLSLICCQSHSYAKHVEGMLNQLFL